MTKTGHQTRSRFAGVPLWWRLGFAFYALLLVVALTLCITALAESTWLESPVAPIIHLPTGEGWTRLGLVRYCAHNLSISIGDGDCQTYDNDHVMGSNWIAAAVLLALTTMTLFAAFALALLYVSQHGGLRWWISPLVAVLALLLLLAAILSFASGLDRLSSDLGRFDEPYCPNAAQFDKGDCDWGPGFGMVMAALVVLVLAVAMGLLAAWRAHHASTRLHRSQIVRHYDDLEHVRASKTRSARQDKLTASSLGGSSRSSSHSSSSVSVVIETIGNRRQPDYDHIDLGSSADSGSDLQIRATDPPPTVAQTTHMWWDQYPSPGSVDMVPVGSERVPVDIGSMAATMDNDLYSKLPTMTAPTADDKKSRQPVPHRQASWQDQTQQQSTGLPSTFATARAPPTDIEPGSHSAPQARRESLPASLQPSAQTAKVTRARSEGAYATIVTPATLPLSMRRESSRGSQLSSSLEATPMAVALPVSRDVMQDKRSLAPVPEHIDYEPLRSGRVLPPRSRARISLTRVVVTNNPTVSERHASPVLEAAGQERNLSRGHYDASRGQGRRRGLLHERRFEADAQNHPAALGTAQPTWRRALDDVPTILPARGAPLTNSRPAQSRPAGQPARPHPVRARRRHRAKQIHVPVSSELSHLPTDVPALHVVVRDPVQAESRLQATNSIAGAHAPRPSMAQQFLSEAARRARFQYQDSGIQLVGNDPLTAPQATRAAAHESSGPTALGFQRQNSARSTVGRDTPYSTPTITPYSSELSLDDMAELAVRRP